jgi:alpha-tubulin suppressor-like RCC1 family protein
VVAVGYDGLGQCSVENWTGIIHIAANGDHTVGVESDGTVIAVGDNTYGQCDVGAWNPE